MLDLKELDASLKIKALGKLINSDHPFLKIIRNNLKLDNFFAPSCRTNIEAVTNKALEILRRDRDILWDMPELITSAKFISTVRKLDLRWLVSEAGKTSIGFFNLWIRGVRHVKDLNRNDLDMIRRFVDRRRITLITQAISLTIDQPVLRDHIYTGKMFKLISSCTAKDIRASRCKSDPITNFKCELDLTESEARSWLLRVSKLSSTRHKNVLIRYLHGEIYTKERLFRFGMIESPNCPRCDSIETLNHKFIECEYIRRIWGEVNRLTNRRQLVDQIKDTMVVTSRHQEDLTLHAEIMLRITYLKDEQNYLIRPKTFVQLALRDLVIKERNEVVKTRVKDLLDAV